MQRLLAIASASVLVIASPAIAQMDVGASGISLGSSLMSANMISSNLSVGSRISQRRHSFTPALSNPSPIVPNDAITTFRANPAVTVATRRRFLSFVAHSYSPSLEAALERDYAHEDPLRLWARSAASDGMRLGDVADAMAEYWTLNWILANQAPDASPAAVQAVRRQVLLALRENPSFVRLDPAGRQEMAEIFIYNGLLQASIYQGAVQRHDRTQVDRISDSAVARFQKEARINLRAVELTPQGLAPKG